MEVLYFIWQKKQITYKTAKKIYMLFIPEFHPSIDNV